MADVQRRKSEFQLQLQQQLAQADAQLQPLWAVQPLAFTAQELKDSLTTYPASHLTSFATDRQQLPMDMSQAAVVAFLQPILAGLADDKVAAFVDHLRATLIDSKQPPASPVIDLGLYARLSTVYPSTIGMFAMVRL